jgi:hypothetical protein
MIEVMTLDLDLGLRVVYYDKYTFVQVGTAVHRGDHGVFFVPVLLIWFYFLYFYS